MGCGTSGNIITNVTDFWDLLKLPGFTSCLEIKMVVLSEDIKNNVSEVRNMYKR